MVEKEDSGEEEEGGEKEEGEGGGMEEGSCVYLAIFLGRCSSGSALVMCFQSTE